MSTNLEPVMTDIRIYPVFGPERDTYLRMIYGTKSQPWSGVTSGRFYDKRALPVPWSPIDRTWFQIDLPDKTYDGFVAKVIVKREGNVEGGASEALSVALAYPTTVFSTRLGKGLNKLQLVDTKRNVEIAVTEVTAARYATFLQSLANKIHSNVWQRLEILENDIFSEDATALTAPLMGFDEHFPNALNLNRTMRALVVNALMNYPSSVRSIEDIGQALFGSRPLVFKAKRSDWSNGWLSGVETRPDQNSSRSIMLWPPNMISARFANIATISWNAGLETISKKSIIEVEGLMHDFSSLLDPIEYDYKDIESWIELQSSFEENEFNFWPHNRPMGIIQQPGLWDYERSYFDAGSTFDSGSEMDQSSKSIDPAQNGFVGLSISPRRPLDPTGEIPVGMLSMSSCELVATCEAYVGELIDTEELIWVLDETSTLADVVLFNASAPVTIDTAVVPGGPGLGLYVEITNISSDHVHLASTLTKSQMAAIKAGTPLVVLSQNPAESDIVDHQHSLTISWLDGWVIDFDNNHGHGVNVIEV